MTQTSFGLVTRMVNVNQMHLVCCCLNLIVFMYSRFLQQSLENDRETTESDMKLVTNGIGKSNEVIKLIIHHCIDLLTMSRAYNVIHGYNNNYYGMVCLIQGIRDCCTNYALLKTTFTLGLAVIVW